MTFLIDPDTLATLQMVFPGLRFVATSDPGYHCENCSDVEDPVTAELLIRCRRGDRTLTVPTCGACATAEIADAHGWSHVVAVDVLTTDIAKAA